MSTSNVRYILNYICIIIAFLIGGIFFRQSFIALFLILLVILPMISIFSLKTGARKITFDAKVKTASVIPGNDIYIIMQVKNAGFMAFLNNRIRFKINNLYYPQDIDHVVSIPAIPRKTKEVMFPVKTSHLGIVELTFTSLEITDFLHLYTVKMPVNIFLQIPVMPKTAESSYTVPKVLATNEEEDEQFVQYGAATHDLKETREYHPGDSIKNIHWKLTARVDNLIVKEYEQSAERTITILPEMCLDGIDETITNLYSLSLSLIKNREFFKILTFSPVTKEITAHTIESQENLDRVIMELYHCSLYEMKRFALNTFFELYGSEKAVIHIIKDSITFLNGENGDKISLLAKEDYIDGNPQ